MKNIAKTKRQLYMALFFISWIGIILTTIYTMGFYTQQTGASHLSTLHPGQLLTRPVWMERIYFFFYFTQISNMFAVVVSTSIWIKSVNYESKNWQRTKVMMAVNLTITFLVYWILLAKDANWNNGLSTASTIFLHALTPLLAIGIFIFESVADKTTKRNIKALSTTGWNFIFPVLWLIVAIVLYYTTGGNENSAIYANIIDFNNHATLTTGVIIGIAAAYLLLTFGATYLYSRKLGSFRRIKLAR